MNGEQKYSAIIIGGGMTGLSTGLAWTKVYNPVEKPVLILEKQPVVGGCVASFARKGYRFDTVQIIPDVSDILDFFELDIELTKFRQAYARLFLADPTKKTAKIFPIAADKTSFEEDLIRLFPSDKGGIKSFFTYCSEMHDELRYLKTEPRFHELFSILFHCKKILANSNKNYHQFLNRFGFKNPELFEVLDTFSSFSGLAGGRCASLLTACAMITTLRGSYRPKQSFIQFPHELKRVFQTNGGEIRMNTRVTKILADKGQAVGVQLDDGTIIRADHVISTADTQITFGQLLGYDELYLINRKYAQKAEHADMSPSALAIHLGLDAGLDLEALGYDCGYNVLTTGHEAHEKMFQSWEQGELLMSDDCFHLATISPAVQTRGKANLIIHVVPVPIQGWTELRESDYDKYMAEKERIAAFYIKKVEEYMIPNLHKHITFMDVSSPATYSRYLGSPTGSNYDMLPLPSNFGKNRLPTRTPLKGLFLPKFSHGIWPSMQAGLQVIDMISGRKIMGGNSSLS